MRLIIVHYHLRPGGIRRIIELGTPHILRCLAIPREVVLAAGEANDPRWNEHFRKQLKRVPLRFFIEPAFRYISEQRGSAGSISKRIRRALDQLFVGAEAGNTVVWIHNAGIARNLLLTRELAAICESRGIPLIAHHHDWWFDNRWLRWPEIQRCGFRTLAEAARAVFPASEQVRHATINHSDAAVLKRHLRQHIFWIPNLTETQAPPARSHVERARRWMHAEVGERDAPIWIVPCRLLRRKNLAEALLLKRLLRPEAWLVTTGAVSSNDELAYADKLSAGAEKHGWRMRLSVLSGKNGSPSVAELLGASECVLLTSVQEGFGLPYLEAATARRPLIARALPNIAPDLKKFGFRFPQYYDELLVPMEVIDARAERQRQCALFRAWKEELPAAARKWVEQPLFLQAWANGSAAPFSRLTLSAQIEVLQLDRETLWKACAPLNPFLKEWAKRAELGELELTHWPARANDWLQGPAYAKRWMRTLQGVPARAPTQSEAMNAQNGFVQWKLGAEYLYPLLWARET